LTGQPDYIHEEVWGRYSSKNASYNGVHHHAPIHFPSKHLSIKKIYIYIYIYIKVKLSLYRAMEAHRVVKR
jgi:hypothetical protein